MYLNAPYHITNVLIFEFSVFRILGIYPIQNRKNRFNAILIILYDLHFFPEICIRLGLSFIKFQSSHKLIEINSTILFTFIFIFIIIKKLYYFTLSSYEDNENATNIFLSNEIDPYK